MTAVLIWLVEKLMDFLAWPVGIWDWPPAGWYQWVGQHWLYPLLCRQDPALAPKE